MKNIDIAKTIDGEGTYYLDRYRGGTVWLSYKDLSGLVSDSLELFLKYHNAITLLISEKELNNLLMAEELGK